MTIHNPIPKAKSETCTLKASQSALFFPKEIKGLMPSKNPKQ